MMVLFLGVVCGLVVSHEMGVCGGTVLTWAVGVDEMGAPELLALMG
jgi:hypothetical protein